MQINKIQEFSTNDLISELADRYDVSVFCGIFKKKTHLEGVSQYKIKASGNKGECVGACLDTAFIITKAKFDKEQSKVDYDG